MNRLPPQKTRQKRVMKYKASKRENNIIADTNEMENFLILRQNQQNQDKSWFFVNMSQMDKALA